MIFHYSVFCRIYPCVLTGYIIYNKCICCNVARCQRNNHSQDASDCGVGYVGLLNPLLSLLCPPGKNREITWFTKPYLRGWCYLVIVKLKFLIMKLYLGGDVSKGYADWIILSEKNKLFWKTFSLIRKIVSHLLKIVKVAVFLLISVNGLVWTWSIEHYLLQLYLNRGKWIVTN